MHAALATKTGCTMKRVLEWAVVVPRSPLGIVAGDFNYTRSGGTTWLVGAPEAVRYPPVGWRQRRLEVAEGVFVELAQSDATHDSNDGGWLRRIDWLLVSRPTWRWLSTEARTVVLDPHRFFASGVSDHAALSLAVSARSSAPGTGTTTVAHTPVPLPVLWHPQYAQVLA